MSDSPVPIHADLVSQARAECDALLTAEQALRDDLHTLCQRLWLFGCSLAALRDLIGNGKWQLFVAANFPQLAGNDTSRRKRAADAMAFFRANPDARILPNDPSSGHFSVESIRACVFHLAPEKERPQLPGDAALSPRPHQLTFVNVFSRWDQRIKAGLDPAPPPEVFRRDMEPVARRMIELGGREWLTSLLA